MTEREEQAITVLNTLYNNPLLSDIHRQALEVGIKAIKALSSSENQKMGQWKRISRDLYVQHAMAYYECSECGKKMIGTHNYCPNCGAKMSEIPTGAEGRDKE